MSENTLTKEDVVSVAALAKLRLSDTQKEKFRVQLAAIMEYMDLLNEVDTTEVEPTTQVNGLTNVFRDDIPKESLDRERLLSLAPEKENGYVKVRTVFAETDFDA
ncbi:Asp-tRNA(Asn)/Glu-tRNA(Gln) amidotransferase subunit GatC [candidate division WWE3 bacterium]|uniref:Aspartyl/glutamyl-tRNA(Asn/Gln) amidotransferase subunit C n=1 Tax=candidate division WWE3 bacterium TaxID=2053526 RepID=A0A955LHL2_UNCKA|nr:Asp-tRNA(Asn)/Glu-tRNA(Gln) amidotransferase subunit GatC [candidate division WWE3 bacterium]